MNEPLLYLAAPEERRTPWFVMRSYHPGDGARLHEAVQASVDHLSPWLTWASRDQTLEDAENLVRRSRGRYLLAEDFTLGVFSPDGKRLLGGTGFHLKDGGLACRSAEIGMFIRQDEAGKGLGSRLLVELLRWGFSEWPWRRLAWRCDASNVASRRCAEKAGLSYEGTLREHMLSPRSPVSDTVCYAALRDEWNPPDLS